MPGIVLLAGGWRVGLFLGSLLPLGGVSWTASGIFAAGGFWGIVALVCPAYLAAGFSIYNMYTGYMAC